MELAPSDVLTIGGASVVVNIVVAVTLKALAFTDAAKDRWGAIVACAEGIAIVGGFAAYQHAPLDAAVLTGLLAGATSIGIYDTVLSVKSALTGK